MSQCLPGRSSYIGRGILNVNRGLDRVDCTIVFVPKLPESRQASVQSQRGVGRQSRRGPVPGDGERVRLVTALERVDGLRRDAPHRALGARVERHSQRRELVGTLNRTGIHRAAANHKPTEVVRFQILVGLQHRGLQISWRIFDGEVDMKVGAEGQGGGACLQAFWQRPESAGGGEGDGDGQEEGEDSCHGHSSKLHEVGSQGLELADTLAAFICGSAGTGRVPPETS